MLERIRKMGLLVWFISAWHVPLLQWLTRMLFFAFFFPPLAYYLLFEWIPLQDRPQGLDLGVATVAAALGGLVLNAGLNLKGCKRKETILVAQKFIVVVIMMILFVPTLYFVELLDGVDTNVVEPDRLLAGTRAVFLWLAAILFYGGIILFLFTLVDLAFAMVGIHKDKYAGGKCRCDGCSHSDTS